MAAVLDRESQEIGSDSADAAAASVCGTIGNLLGLASDHAAVNQPNDTNTTSSRNLEQETKRLKVSDQVSLENAFNSLMLLHQYIFYVLSSAELFRNQCKV